MLFRFVLCLSFFVVVQSRANEVCRCSRSGSGEGFYFEGNIQKLPKNAKGVIFFLKKEGSKISFDEPESSHFEVRDDKTKKTVAIRVKKLEMEKAVTKPEFLYFRLEPIQGFVVGHSYTFKLKGEQSDPSPYRHLLTVQIGPQEIRRPNFEKVRFLRDGTATTQELITGHPGACRQRIQALVQEVKFILPPELKGFSESMRYFVHTVDGPKRQSWLYRMSLCQEVGFGRSYSELGKDLVFLDPKERKKTFAGSWTFPEVDATIHQGASFALTQ